jgi:hypothetical protein
MLAVYALSDFTKETCGGLELFPLLRGGPQMSSGDERGWQNKIIRAGRGSCLGQSGSYYCADLTVRNRSFWVVAAPVIADMGTSMAPVETKPAGTFTLI